MVVQIRLLFLLFTLGEIAGFVVVGRIFGVAATLGLVLLGFVVGGMLLRAQGIATLGRLRTDMAARRLPTQTLADGAMKAVAALLLIVPGFLSDIAGLLLLVPPVRHAIRRFGTSRLAAAKARPGWRPAGSRVIDLDAGEFRSRDPRAPRLPPDGS